VTFNEDASTLRAGTAPQTMAIVGHAGYGTSLLPLDPRKALTYGRSTGCR